MLRHRSVSGSSGRSSPSSWPRCRASTISRTKLLSPFCWVKCAAAAMTVLNRQPWSSSAGLAPPAPGEGKLGHGGEGEGAEGRARTVQEHLHAFEVVAALFSTGQDERRYIVTSRHRVRIDSHVQQYLDAGRRALKAHVAKELLEVLDGGRRF